MTHQAYVCVDVQRDNLSDILLMKKARGPECVRGKLALVGGHVEPNEAYIDAAHRELEEETGLGAVDVAEMWYSGCLEDDNEEWSVYFFGASLKEGCSKTPFNKDDTEPVHWYNLKSLDKKLLVPNLKVTLPLIRIGSGTWHCYDSIMDMFSKNAPL